VSETPSFSALDKPPTLNGVAVLNEVRAALTRYVVFPDDESADAVTLYVAATWASPKLSYATRLIIRSPERRCGKSRLIADVLPHLVRHPLKAVSISPAALVHSISEDDPPTIILDETDTVFTKGKPDEKAELLRGILNGGFTRGMPYVRWDPMSRSRDECVTFAPVILAGINNGRMPDTIEDRAIIVTLRRKLPHESVARYRERKHAPALRALGATLADWVTPIIDRLADAEPDLPDVLNDRAQDAWESLLAVADAAGGTWPKRARTAALKLSGSAEDDDTDSRRLLADLRDIFGGSGSDVMTTDAILGKLHGIDEAPWGSWFGHPLTARDLAGLLKPYSVKPKVVRIGDSTPRGYLRAHLEDAWSRYIPPLGEDGETKRNSATSQVSSQFGSATQAQQEAQQALADVEADTRPEQERCGSVAPVLQEAGNGISAGRHGSVAVLRQVAGDPPNSECDHRYRGGNPHCIRCGEVVLAMAGAR
jgi:hypothetical protein